MRSGRGRATQVSFGGSRGAGVGTQTGRRRQVGSQQQRRPWQRRRARVDGLCSPQAPAGELGPAGQPQGRRQGRTTGSGGRGGAGKQGISSDHLWPPSGAAACLPVAVTAKQRGLDQRPA